MKATKTELIRLARLAQKDIASGRLSKNAQQAVEVLADYQNSAIELLDLTLEEAAKKQSNKSLARFFWLSVRPSFGGSALRYRVRLSDRVRTRRKRSQAVSYGDPNWGV